MNKEDIAILGHILNEKIIFPDKEICPVLEVVRQLILLLHVWLLWK
jgi:hypothetical protein